eukprot:1159292-Pelagomonas_calceolata.AAC.3
MHASRRLFLEGASKVHPHLVEGVPEGEQLIQQAAERPYVAAELVGMAFYALWAHVAGGANCRSGSSKRKHLHKGCHAHMAHVEDEGSLR